MGTVNRCVWRAPFGDTTGVAVERATNSKVIVGLVNVSIHQTRVRIWHLVCMLSRTALLKGYTSEPVVFDSVGMKTLFEVEKMA